MLLEAITYYSDIASKDVQFSIEEIHQVVADCQYDPVVEVSAAAALVSILEGARVGEDHIDAMLATKAHNTDNIA